MPTYRYRCAKCGEEHDVWQSFDEKPKTRHNGGCGGKLAKVMSPAGIVLKGSGFYKTDNRSSSKSSSTSASRDKESSSSSSSESSSESKSESKSSESKSDSTNKSNGDSKSNSSSNKETSSTKS